MTASRARGFGTQGAGQVKQGAILPHEARADATFVGTQFVVMQRVSWYWGKDLVVIFLNGGFHDKEMICKREIGLNWKRFRGWETCSSIALLL